MYKTIRALMGNKTTEMIELCKELYKVRMYGNWRTQEAVCNELFAKVCQLAKSRHCRIEWCGFGSVCQPDKFIIYKNGTQYFLGIDGLIYNGVNALCRVM
jgi:hypothetical protein